MTLSVINYAPANDKEGRKSLKRQTDKHFHGDKHVSMNSWIIWHIVSYENDIILVKNMK